MVRLSNLSLSSNSWQQVLSHLDLDAILAAKNIVQSAETKCKARQKWKFDALLENSYLTCQSYPLHEKRVVSLSDMVLNEDEMDVLRKGLNFVPTAIPMSGIIPSVEKSLLKIPKELATTARKQVSNILARSHLPPSNLPPRPSRPWNGKSPFIILADKGRASVVMSTEVYDRKMTGMLSDTSTYERLKCDPVLSIGGSWTLPSWSWRSVDPLTSNCITGYIPPLVWHPVSMAFPRSTNRMYPSDQLSCPTAHVPINSPDTSPRFSLP